MTSADRRTPGALQRTTILADPDLLDRVDRHARRSGMTKTAVITVALEAYLEANETTPELPFLAIGRSGHGRLSLDGRSIAAKAVERPRTG